VVTLLADDDVGAVTPDEAEVDEVLDDAEPDFVVPDEVEPDDEPEAVVDVDFTLDDDPVTWVVAGDAAWDDSDAANTAVPAVSAMATPATPVVIRLTRRRARCRRVTASLGLGKAWLLRFAIMETTVPTYFWPTLGRSCVAAVNRPTN
jgi:hypothetical protein